MYITITIWVGVTYIITYAIFSLKIFFFQKSMGMKSSRIKSWTFTMIEEPFPIHFLTILNDYTTCTPIEHDVHRPLVNNLVGGSGCDLPLHETSLKINCNGVNCFANSFTNRFTLSFLVLSTYIIRLANNGVWPLEPCELSYKIAFLR